MHRKHTTVANMLVTVVCHFGTVTCLPQYLWRASDSAKVSHHCGWYTYNALWPGSTVTSRPQRVWYEYYSIGVEGLRCCEYASRPDTIATWRQ